MPPQHSMSVPHNRSLDSVSVWAVIVTVVAALVVVLPSSPVSSAAIKAFLLAAGALVALALYILTRLTRGNIIFPSSVLVAALWLPTLAYALSTAFSGVPFASAVWGTALEPDTLGFMLTVAVLGTLTALVLRRIEHYRFFLRIGAYVFGAIALLSAATIVIGQFMPMIVAPDFTVIGSYRDLASFLGLGIISVLITFRFLELSEITRRALLIISAMALFLLAVANFSIVWVLLALVSLGFFVEAVMRHGPKVVDADLDEAILLEESPLGSNERNRSLALPLLVLAVSLFFLISGTLGGALANALHVNILNVRPSWQSTLTVAEKTYATSPIFGSGPSTFGSEWLKYRDASLNSTVFWNIDFTSGIGFIPTSAVTTGGLGMLAWFGFFALFIVLGLRTLIFRAPQDAFMRYIAIISFVGSLYLFALAVFDFPNAAMLALAFVFMGLFISTSRYALNGRQWGVLFSKSPRVGFVIVFTLTILLLSLVVAAYALIGRYVAEAEFSSAVAAFSSGNLDAADQAAQNALSFAPSVEAYQLQALIAKAQLALIAASSTMEKTAAQQAYQTTLSTGINAALTATNLNPSDYQSWVQLGNLYAQAVPIGVSGAYSSAKTAYQKAEALNPTNPQIPYVLAQLDIANKDTKSAEADLKAAIALKQDYTDAIFLLSQLEVQDGNIKDALNTALAAAYFAPKDPNVLFQVGVLYAAENDFADAATALSGAVAANSQFANARYLLAAVYAKQGDMSQALGQMQAIAGMSSSNATAVASQITALTAGKNPFPVNLLSASSTPVK